MPSPLKRLLSRRIWLGLQVTKPGSKPFEWRKPKEEKNETHGNNKWQQSLSYGSDTSRGNTLPQNVPALSYDHRGAMFPFSYGPWRKWEQWEQL